MCINWSLAKFGKVLLIGFHLIEMSHKEKYSIYIDTSKKMIHSTSKIHIFEISINKIIYLKNHNKHVNYNLTCYFAK